jgi:glycosyltransferase involved in cell wall biosynthesis
MRVLHTVASLDPATGGPARSVPDLAGALQRVGVQCLLRTAVPWKEAWVLPLLEAGVEVLPPGEGWQGAAVDLIHDHGLWLPSNHQVARLAGRRGLARVVSPRGMLEPWALNHRKWKKRLAWHLYQKRDLGSAALLHATADSEAEQFRRLGLRGQIVTLPNGVDLPPAGAGGPPVQDDAVRTVLFLSRIHPKKGLPMLLQAWSRLRPEGWRLRIAGPDEGGHRAELERLADELKLRGSVSLEGALEGAEKEEAFRECGLVVLPTFSENFGIVVAEALARGLPVITTTGAPWQGLLTRRCGWWVAPEVAALEGALREACARDPQALREMGQRGVRWMAEDFSWQGIARRMAAAYEGIVSGRGPAMMARPPETRT